MKIIRFHLHWMVGSQRNGLGTLGFHDSFFKECTCLPSPSQVLMSMAFSPPSLPPILCPGQLYCGTLAPSCLPPTWTSSCLGTSGPAASRHGELCPQINQQLTLSFSSGVCSKAASQRGFSDHALGCCNPCLFFLLICLFDFLCLTYLPTGKAESLRTGTLFHSLFIVHILRS